MKTLILILAVGLFFSCEENENLPQSKLTVVTSLESQTGISYSESIGNRNELKNKNGNSYVYHTKFASWLGEDSITEVTIIDGIVISRVYEHFKTNETNGRVEIIDSYSETTSNLGVHEKGAVPITIDALYSTCASDYLTVDVQNNTIIL
ncbi:MULTISPECIES: hypothetical protein [unclassified Polaribacter]|uniref:hypothetical protein n=1 Tax=unclassified Polaribacter TaxID=196858 RepID=UPI0011BFAAE2|nr:MULTISPECIES: hypothetical protein [unclassified Polaribacter]TXD53220.1 hypothetical protein ES043_05115 [Polaribacter sp. IC063]TXD61367.1 hypothetical protein ES044_05085 [Polaribacter sp. IC066]